MLQATRITQWQQPEGDQLIYTHNNVLGMLKKSLLYFQDVFPMKEKLPNLLHTAIINEQAPGTYKTSS